MMNYRVVFVAAMSVSAVAVGCSRAAEPTSQGGPDSSFPIVGAKVTLALEPADLLSNVGSTQLRVGVRPYDVSSATLSAIAAGVRLRSYPTLVDLPVSTIVHPGSVGGTGSGPVPKDAAVPPFAGPTEAYVEVVPKAPLPASGWYVLTVDGLPKDVAAPWRAYIPSEPMAHAARFSIGSSPVVRFVSINQKGYATLGFSEGIAIDEKSIDNAVQLLDDTSKPCSYLPRGVQNLPPYFSTLSFQCPTSAYTNARLRVSFKVALKTQGGASLQLLDRAATKEADLLNAATGVVEATPLSASAPGGLTWTP